jgi:hypothetical protein
MEASLRDALNWTQSSNALPVSGTAQQPVTSELAATARMLIEEERTGVRYLCELAQRERASMAACRVSCWR